MYVEYLVGRMTFLNQTQTLGQVAKVTVTHRGYASLLIIHIHSIEWIIASCQVQILAFGEQSCAYCLLWQYKRIIFLISSWTLPSPASFILSHGLSLYLLIPVFYTHTRIYMSSFLYLSTSHIVICKPDVPWYPLAYWFLLHNHVLLVRQNCLNYTPHYFPTGVAISNEEGRRSNDVLRICFLLDICIP